MRQSAARLNRAWLVVLGLLLLLVGLLVLVTGAGLLRPVGRSVGLDLGRPAPSDGLVGAGAGTGLDLGWVVVLIALAGVVVALAGLAWLVAQVPRANQATPFRLSDSPADGLTVCAPGVLTDAVEVQVRALPDVTDASAVLRGSLAAPELTIKVTTSDRADIPALLDTLQNRVAADLGGALDTRLHRLGVQVEVGRSRSTVHQVVL